MASFLKEIGVQVGDRKKTLNSIGEAAERTSRIIWRWSKFRECEDKGKTKGWKKEVTQKDGWTKENNKVQAVVVVVVCGPLF